MLAENGSTTYEEVLFNLKKNCKKVEITHRKNEEIKITNNSNKLHVENTTPETNTKEENHGNFRILLTNSAYSKENYDDITI